MKKIRIIALHLAFGGIEKAVCSMANLFAERYDVEILSVYKIQELPAFPLDARVKVRYLLKETPNREAWKAALQAHRLPDLLRESVQALHILRAKKKAVTEAILETQEGVVITTRPEDNVLLSRFGRENVLKIAQLHQDHRFDKKLVRSFRRDYGRIDIFTLLTPGLAEEVRGMLHGRNEHTKPVYIPNFLEHYPGDPGKNTREKTVLSVGRLNAVKRFDLLIRLFCALHARFPKWRLRIVGEGEEREKLETLIRELSAGEYVTLTGKKDSSGVEDEMLHASVFAMTSASEGFPFVLLEAQSCALPVIAFDVRVGPGFVIEDGENGLLVPEGDRQRFCEGLAELMEEDDLRERMASAAVKHAAAFSRDKVGQLWYAVIGE